MSNKQSASARMVMEVRDGKENPFWTIEALGEQLGSVRHELAGMGHPIPIPTFYAQTKTPEFWEGITQDKGLIYHFLAVEEYQQKVFQYMAALLPKLYAASDGDEEALASIKQELTNLANEHQRKWDEITNR